MPTASNMLRNEQVTPMIMSERVTDSGLLTPWKSSMSHFVARQESETNFGAEHFPYRIVIMGPLIGQNTTRSNQTGSAALGGISIPPMIGHVRGAAVIQYALTPHDK